MTRFKQEEKEFVLWAASNNKDADVVNMFAAQFGRKVSLYSIRQLRRRLGLKKTGGRGRWTTQGKVYPGKLSMWLFGVNNE